MPQVGAFQGLPFPASGRLRQKFAFRQIDERVRPLNNGTKRKENKGAAGRYLSGIAVSRKREPTAKICLSAN